MSETLKYESQVNYWFNRSDKAEALYNSSEKAINALFAKMFFCKFRDSKDVKFGLLDQATPNVVIELPTVKNGVILTVKEERTEKNVIIYYTHWTPGSMLPNHYHSDCIERITVKEGSAKVVIEDPVTKKPSFFRLEAGQSIDIGACIKHQTTALEESNIKIEFFKVEENNLTPS